MLPVEELAFLPHFASQISLGHVIPVCIFSISSSSQVRMCRDYYQPGVTLDCKGLPAISETWFMLGASFASALEKPVPIPCF